MKIERYRTGGGRRMKATKAKNTRGATKLRRLENAYSVAQHNYLLLQPKMNPEGCESPKMVASGDKRKKKGRRG